MSSGVLKRACFKFSDAFQEQVKVLPENNIGQVGEKRQGQQTSRRLKNLTAT
jgi:hypothetical protein